MGCFIWWHSIVFLFRTTKNGLNWMHTSFWTLKMIPNQIRFHSQRPHTESWLTFYFIFADWSLSVSLFLFAWNFQMVILDSFNTSAAFMPSNKKKIKTQKLGEWCVVVISSFVCFQCVQKYLHIIIWVNNNSHLSLLCALL